MSQQQPPTDDESFVRISSTAGLLGTQPSTPSTGSERSGSGMSEAAPASSSAAATGSDRRTVNWRNHPLGDADGPAATAADSRTQHLPPGAPGSHATPSDTPFSIKAQLAQMLKGGVIMDVMTPEQARIAEAAGACAVMALERIPSQIRLTGGVARMSHPSMIRAIQGAVSIPVMAKVRVGHFVEAQILQALDVDFIDESEVLTPADDELHIDKRGFRAPFVCGCRDLGEALRRIREGAAMIRTKGEAGTGNVVEAVRHARKVASQISRVCATRDEMELARYARELGVDVGSLREVQRAGRLPVVQFAAGGVATPADAALMMQLGMDGVFVGSGVFESSDPPAMAAAIVQAVTHFRDPAMLAQISEKVGTPMRGMEIDPAKMVMFATRESP